MRRNQSKSLKVSLIAVGAKASSQLAYMTWTAEQNVNRVAIVPNNYIPSATSVDHLIHLPHDHRVATATLQNMGDIAENIISPKMSEIVGAAQESGLVIFRGNIASNLIAHEIKLMATKFREQGKLVLYAYALPFFFEGQQPQVATRVSEQILNGFVDAMIPIESDSLVLPGMTAAEALSAVSGFIEEFTSACISMVQNHGTINVDWNDIRSTVVDARKVHVKTMTGSVEQPDALVEKAFSAKPGQLSNGEYFQKAVYVISSGSDVSAQAINELGSKIQAKLAPDARIIFGLENKDFSANEIGLTLVAGAA